MSDQFIREVDDELQRERLAALWDAYGLYLVGGAVAVVVAVASNVGWNAWTQASRDADADAFHAATSLYDAGDANAAAAFAALADDAGGDVATLARFGQARALEEAEDFEGARAAFAAVRSDDPLMRGLAQLGEASLLLSQGQSAQAEAALEALAAVGEPWRHSARELLASIALERGDEARAVDLLRQVAQDASAPANLRARAELMMEALGVAAPVAAPEAAAGPDAAAPDMIE